MYRVGSFIDFDTDYGTPSMFQYFQSKEAQANKPDVDAGLGCHCLLLALYSKVRVAKLKLKLLQIFSFSPRISGAGSWAGWMLMETERSRPKSWPLWMLTVTGRSLRLS